MPRYFGLVSMDEGVYLISFPDLPGCSASAPTLSRLKKEARKRLGADLVEYLASGDPLPVPCSREKIATHPLAGSSMILDVQASIPKGRG
jgi:predicted RNase H-like HicB family nuclease